MARVVLDPVMVATSGATLIDREAIEVLVTQMFPRAVLVTADASPQVLCRKGLAKGELASQAVERGV